MTHESHPHTGLAHWLFLLFLTAVFFLNYHDLTNNYHSLPSSQGKINNLNASIDQISDAVNQGSPLRRITLLSLGIVAIISLARRRVRPRFGCDGPLGWLILSFVAWAFISLIWAQDLPLTLRRLVVFGIFCIAALAVACRLSLREIMLWAFLSTALFLVIGILAELAYGTFQPFASGYRFAGTLHPNGQGINCALLMLSGLAAAQNEKRGRILFRACAFVALVFLILTGSRAAFGSTLFALAVYVAAMWSRRAKAALGLGLGIALCALLIALGNAALPDLQSAVLLGRDNSSVATFSGRIGIWEDLGHYIRQRPILGYGYCGFWTPERIAEISEEENWAVPHSHSTYIEYLLSLGTVGLAAYALLIFAGIRRAFVFYKLSRNPAFAFSGTLLVFYALDGFFEVTIFEGSLIMFLCMVILVRLGFMCRRQTIGFDARKDQDQSRGLHRQREQIPTPI